MATLLVMFLGDCLSKDIVSHLLSDRWASLSPTLQMEGMLGHFCCLEHSHNCTGTWQKSHKGSYVMVIQAALHLQLESMWQLQPQSRRLWEDWKTMLFSGYFCWLVSTLKCQHCFFVHSSVFGDILLAMKGPSISNRQMFARVFTVSETNSWTFVKLSEKMQNIALTWATWKVSPFSRAETGDSSSSSVTLITCVLILIARSDNRSLSMFNFPWILVDCKQVKNYIHLFYVLINLCALLCLGGRSARN